MLFLACAVAAYLNGFVLALDGGQGGLECAAGLPLVPAGEKGAAKGAAE